jgi:hypothetical protein
LRIARLIVAITAFLLSTMPAAADATYVYVGNHFWFAQNSPGFPQFSTSDYVTASLTFSSPLAPNMSLQSVTPISWYTAVKNVPGFVFTSSDQPSNTFSLEITTDSSGNIIQWYLGVNSGASYVGTKYYWSSINGMVIADSGSQTSWGFNMDNPGTWSSNVVPTPEPCTLALAGAGVAFVIRLGRKKLRSRHE